MCIFLRYGVFLMLCYKESLALPYLQNNVFRVDATSRQRYVMKITSQKTLACTSIPRDHKYCQKKLPERREKKCRKCWKGCRKPLSEQTLSEVLHAFITDRFQTKSFKTTMFLMILKIAMNPKHSQTQGPFSRRRRLVFWPIFFKKSSVAKYGCKSTSLATWAQTNDLFSVATPSHFTHQRQHHSKR